MEQEHVTDLIPAYALGCLDTGEAEVVTRHVAACPVCRAEVESYRRIHGQLALAGPLATPAPELRGRLLMQVAVPRAPARPAPRGLPRPSTSRPSTSRPSLARPPSLWQRIAGFSQRIAPVWTPVSLLLIVGLVAVNLLLWQASPPPSSEADLVAVQMTGTDQAPAARGVLSAAAYGQSALLVVQGLPPLDAAQQYQLWLIQDGQRTNGGVFSVDATGFGELQVAAPEPIVHYSAFGVTVEPAGGSPGPTGAKVLGGEL